MATGSLHAEAPFMFFSRERRLDIGYIYWARVREREGEGERTNLSSIHRPRTDGTTQSTWIRIEAREKLRPGLTRQFASGHRESPAPLSLSLLFSSLFSSFSLSFLFNNCKAKECAHRTLAPAKVAPGRTGCTSHRLKGERERIL